MSHCHFKVASRAHTSVVDLCAALCTRHLTPDPTAPATGVISARRQSDFSRAPVLQTWLFLKDIPYNNNKINLVVKKV